MHQIHVKEKAGFQYVWTCDIELAEIMLIRLS